MWALARAGAVEVGHRACDARSDFEEYAASRYSALLGMAYLLTQDRQLAEDLVQTTLTRCWLSWNRIEAEDPSAYVRRVMINTHTEWWRRRRQRTEVPTADIGAVEPSQPSTSASIELVERSELLVALRRLPRKMCAVVVLRYFEELSETETAEVLGCSVGTVKSQTHRALAKMRVDLSAQQVMEP
jgi:RNA polymerase sigma-70 factor (sigma-E family)